MPDRPMPPAPEGCVYGPWWDEEIRDEGCWCYSDGELSYAWLPNFSCWVTTEKAALRELLRLAKREQELVAEVAALKDRNKRLVEGLDIGLKAAHSCSCRASYDNDYSAEDIWDERVRQLKTLIAEEREQL